MLILWIAILITDNTWSHAITIVNNEVANTTTLYPVKNTTDQKPSPTNKEIEDHHHHQQNINPNPGTWKIEASYAESKIPEEEIQNDTKVFKPSAQDISDELSSFVLPPTASYPTVTKPTSEFKSSFQKDARKNNYEYLKGEFPYKIESPALFKPQDSWKPTIGLLTTETLPAGGLYKDPEAFREKPSEDGDLAFEFKEEYKETAIKRRRNPWQDILRVLTAFIPVGLIISALTPSVITVDSSANHPPYQQFRFARRADYPVTLADTPSISERCRRRLLCELNVDSTYTKSENPQELSSACRRYRCEDRQTLSKLITWLLKPHDWPLKRTAHGDNIT